MVHIYPLTPNLNYLKISPFLFLFPFNLDTDCMGGILYLVCLSFSTFRPCASDPAQSAIQKTLIFYVLPFTPSENKHTDFENKTKKKSTEWDLM